MNVNIFKSMETDMMNLLVITIFFLATFALAALFVMYRAMFVYTRGKKIEAYQNHRKALMVLDLQEGYNGSNPRQPATTPAEGSIFATVNRLIDWGVDKGVEVIYVRQVFKNSIFVRMHGGRSLGKIIVDRRIKKINENDFEKNRTDAFSNKKLEQFLIEHQVNELYLTGVDAAYCVLYTALGALQRGYKVTVVRDAVRSRADMEKVEERYRKHGINCINSNELIL